MTGISTLFEDHPHLRAVIDAVLEDRQGTIVNVEDPPRAALLELGCYYVPGGDAGHPAARRLLAGLEGPKELVVADDDRWRELLSDVFGDRVRDRSMKAYLPAADMSLTRLDALAGELLAGYELVDIDLPLARQIDDSLTPHGIQVFGGPEGFVRDGLGVCARRDGAPACVATAYALSAHECEVAISTHVDHRGQGLATAVSAALLAVCLRRGVVPHWNASNPVSQRLALRLGFEEVGVCEILMLDG